MLRIPSLRRLDGVREQAEQAADDDDDWGLN